MTVAPVVSRISRESASESGRLEALLFGDGEVAASMRMRWAAFGEAVAHDGGYPGLRWHALMQNIVAASRV